MLKLTLKAWPVIALATIGLCFLTEKVAGLCGFALSEQSNIELVRGYLARAFTSPRAFWGAAFLVAQIVAIMPVIEELAFRGLLVKLPSWFKARRAKTENAGSGSWKTVTFLPVLAALSSALFSAAHYLTQPWPDNAFVALFFFGLAQCWLYLRTDRIWCPMLNHALFNVTNLVLLFLVPEGA